MDPLDIIESTAEPAFATDESGRMVIWNPAVQKLLGYRPEDVLGKPCHEVTCGKDTFGNRFCDTNCNVIGMILRRESINRFSLTIRHANGQGIPLWITIISVPGPKPSQYTAIHILTPASNASPLTNSGDQSASMEITNQQPSTESASLDVPAPVLTTREREVLTLMAKGTSTAEIADFLFISISTVRSHIQSILNKLDAHSKLEAVAVALRRRLI